MVVVERRGGRVGGVVRVGPRGCRRGRDGSQEEAEEDSVELLSPGPSPKASVADAGLAGERTTGGVCFAAAGGTGEGGVV